MANDFIIDQAKWHTERVRNYSFDNSIIYEYFKNIIEYLQSNQLTTRKILHQNESVDDETCLKRSDLTNEGFELIKKVYDKWTDKVVDKKISSDDFTMLDKALKKIRSETK